MNTHNAMQSAQAAPSGATISRGLKGIEIIMNETTSPKKAESNRINCKKSTGPKTAEGKAKSCMNALKHGLLAKQIVVKGQKVHESPGEFQGLCGEFYAALEPAGPLEALLVDQIVQAAWRMRRARVAESGEIAMSVDDGCWEREKSDPLLSLLLTSGTVFARSFTLQLMQTVAGCHYLINCLKKVREGVERDGELTDGVLNDFRSNMRGGKDLLVQKLEGFRAWLTGNPENLEPETLRARHKEEVLMFVGRKMRMAQMKLEECEKRETAHERAQQTASLLPKAPVLERILRYETALERQMFRAMTHLERLQSLRCGNEHGRRRGRRNGVKNGLN